ncbi:MAG: LamG-like jellyroll fold domain-containing protein, partial [Cyclobacteriaceae bacterium]
MKNLTSYLICFLLVSKAVAQPDNYDAYYPFSSSSDLLNNDLGGAKTFSDLSGVAVGDPTQGMDRFSTNSAIYFDGADDGFTIGNGFLEDESEITITLWLQFNFSGQASQYRTLVTKTGLSDHFDLKVRNKICVFEAYDTNGSSAVTLTYDMDGADLSDGSWHHLAITLSNSEAKMYVDGAEEEVASLTSTYDPTAPNGTVSIPVSVAVPTGSDKYFEGSMDELKFYPRALSHQEIIEIGEATTFKSFEVAGAAILAKIDSINHSVNVVLSHPATTGDISFELHTGATSNPALPIIDSSFPATITVTDHDGDAQAWTINSAYYESDIVSFSIEDELIPSAIDAGNHTVTIYMPYGTDLTSLSPIIGVSSGATIEPATGAGQNFSSVVTFTVTALDGEVQDWTCTVIEACFETETTVSPPATWHRDQDEDGFGDPSNSVVQCDQPEGYVLDNTDCNDENPELNPETIWYADTDGDGFGDLSNTTESCEQPTGFVANSLDCEDSNPGITSNWYVDGDADGYGSRAPAGVSDLLGQFTGAGPDDLALWEIAFLGD